jgi:ATP-binding cassette subfamily B protein
MLVLDDCLSAVDTQTEDKILQAISEIGEDTITFIVSHRVSSLRFVDRIIVLEDGKFVEQGSHEMLLSKKGLYTEMFEKQAKDNLKD